MFYAFGAQGLIVGGVSLQRPTMLAYVRGGFYGQSSV